MARVKLSEFRAKSLLVDDYQGFSIRLENLTEDAKQLKSDKNYIIKVDQGVKKRGKQGLIRLDIPGTRAEAPVKELSEKGYIRFIAEPMFEHSDSDEHYLSIERTREGIQVSYSAQGGIDVEEHADSIRSYLLPEEIDSLDEETPFPLEWLKSVLATMDEQHFSFVEINPLVVIDGHPTMLDAAVLVDDAGEYFADGWTDDDVVDFAKQTKSEETVAELDANSPAALKLKVLNPNGSIWTLLSGGGASITIADQVQSAGLDKQLGNYGEYSGGPTTEETYLYTKELLQLMLDSTADKKVLVIAGGVANFTDVAKTFKGLIQAMSEVAEEMQNSGIKVYVRRGGPNEKSGLAAMRDFLQSHDLLGSVHGSDELLTAAISEACDWLGENS